MLHRIQPRGFRRDPLGGAHGATGKSHAAARFVRYFDTLTQACECDCMIADDISRANCGETNRLSIEIRLLPFASVDSNLIQITPQSLGNHLTHFERSARWRILFKAVVCL